MKVHYLIIVISTLIYLKGYGQISYGKNLLMNASFQNRDQNDGPLHWFVSGQTVQISRTEKRGNAQDDLSLLVQNSGNKTPIVIRSVRRAAAPTVTYKASIWCNYKSGAPQQLHLEFWNQDFKRLNNHQLATDSVRGWKKYELTAKAPEQTVYVTISIQTAADASISIWDDAGLQYEKTYDPSVNHYRQLFADDYRIEKMENVERVVHQGVKSNPLIVPDEPWEQLLFHRGTVLFQDNLYKLWYTSVSVENGQEKYFMCYAYSRDGLHFLKPDLSLFSANNNKHNNIIQTGGATFVYDPFDVDTMKRYKMMSMVAENNGTGQKKGYGVFFSPDGFKWTPYDKNPVLLYSNVSNVAFDTAKRLFIATTKQRLDQSSVTPGKLDRAAFVSVSTDFVNWHAPGSDGSLWALAAEGEEEDDLMVQSGGGIEAQVYGMPVLPYEGIYFGVPWLFEVMDYTTGQWAYWGDGPVYAQLSVSRDLKIWEKVSRNPLMEAGGAGTWDAGAIYTSANIITKNKTIELFYTGTSLPHGGSRNGKHQTAQIAKATWRRDGFVSLRNCGDMPGKVITKEIVAGADNLVVNCKLSANGSLTVAVLDSLGRPVSGFDENACIPVTGDQYGKQVRWKSGKSFKQFSGKKIKLQFSLKAGDLYAYWFN